MKVVAAAAVAALALAPVALADGDPTSDYLILHRASCPWINTGTRNNWTTTGYIKTCSTDPVALKAWADARQLNFPLLRDFNKEEIHKHDVYDADLMGMRGTAKRAVFLIDHRGIVRYSGVLSDVRNDPDYNGLKKAAASL